MYTLYDAKRRFAQPALLAGLLGLASLAGPVEAVVVTNNTPYVLRAAVMGYYDAGFEMQPGLTLNILLPGDPADIVGILVDSFELGDPRYLEFDWSSIVTSRKDGYVNIEFIHRQTEFGPEFGPWNIVLWVESYDDAAFTQLRSTSDGTPYDTVRDVRFLATADCQFDQKDPIWNDASGTVCSYMTQTLLADNRIRGILNAGDLTQNTSETEIDMYHGAIAGYGRFWFDGLGNHDYGPQGHADLYASVRDRMRNTPKARRSPVGHPHYSWDWHDVHFVQLNLYAGDCAGGDCGNYGIHDPYEALSFLISDLQDHVGDTCRPVVLVHHYGFDEFSTGETGEMWWTPAQRRAYWDAIANYNVIAVFSGHVHQTVGQRILWNWNRPAPDAGGPPFIPNFVCGAAGYSAYIDVTIEQSGAIQVRRMDSTGSQNYTRRVGPRSELYVQRSSGEPGDGSLDEPFGQVQEAAAYFQPPAPACRTAEAAVVIAPGYYPENVSNLPNGLVLSAPVVLEKWATGPGDVVIGAARP